MFRLVPLVRPGQETPERPIEGDAGAEPIDRQKKSVQDTRAIPPAPSGLPTREGAAAIADQRAGCA